jgi:hypothetical protein
MDLVADGLELTIVNERVYELLDFYETRKTNTTITRACS